MHLNLAYRWFCRLGLDGDVPDHSTFSKDRHGRFRESQLLRELFETTVHRCIEEGLVGGDNFAVDASRIDANANRGKGELHNPVLPKAVMHRRAVQEYIATLDDAAFGAASDAPSKYLSPIDPAARWTRANRSGMAVYSYSVNYLIDFDASVIMDVEGSGAIRQAEVNVTRDMIDRVAENISMTQTDDFGFGTQIRKLPYFDATIRWGAKGFSVYNHMYIPRDFGDPEQNFWNLVNDAILCDVAVERQVEITGSDAAKFVQMLTPRDLSKLAVGQCKYILITNADGGLLNDPILLRLAENHFWISLADSDILLWAQGVAVHAGLDVTICEPDMSPLQLQGPKSGEIMKALFGESIMDLRYYWLRELELDGIPLIVSRTGWSSELGYELYLQDGSRGDELWEKIMAMCSGVMQTIVNCPKPVIAEVTGVATAAGCQLVASCDLAIAADTAKFSTPGVHIGLFCSTPMVALSRNIASKHAMEMLLTGDMISAARDAEIGLINKAVSEDTLRDVTLEMVRKIASKSSLTLATGKKAFYAQSEMPLAEAYDYASKVMVENLLARDAEEGMGAFIEKRTPKWTDS